MKKVESKAYDSWLKALKKKADYKVITSLSGVKVTSDKRKKLRTRKRVSLKKKSQ